MLCWEHLLPGKLLFSLAKNGLMWWRKEEMEKEKREDGPYREK